jgi:hypothetical protein
MTAAGAKRLADRAAQLRADADAQARAAMLVWGGRWRPATDDERHRFGELEQRDERRVRIMPGGQTYVYRRDAWRRWIGDREPTA